MIAMNSPLEFPVIDPDLQITFYYRLKEIKDSYFFAALSQTIDVLDIPTLDKELAKYVKPEYLKKLAKFHMRGEVFFPVPYILQNNPKLVGYYRLLFGISQKEFYSKGPFGTFKHMEEKGSINPKALPYIEAFSRSLIYTGEILVDGIDEFSIPIVNDLQILTLGPQLRGGRNTELGKFATAQTFNLVKALVQDYITKENDKEIIITNDSKRVVSIVFASDPDIGIIEILPSGKNKIVSVEIKGGRDISNIHNRLGEAEKSHRKAKGDGYSQFWTIVRADVDYKLAKKESPTTDELFHLDNLLDSNHEEFLLFRDRLCSILGISIKV